MIRVVRLETREVNSFLNKLCFTWITIFKKVVRMKKNTLLNEKFVEFSRFSFEGEVNYNFSSLHRETIEVIEIEM